MRSPIDELAEELWDCCVLQRAAKDDATLKRWQTDELAHMKERFIVQHMPTEMEPLVEKALAQWDQIENTVFSWLPQSRVQFLSQFEKARESCLRGDDEWKSFAVTGRVVHGAVRNMEWVNLFSWVLPGADPSGSVKHRMVGRMVTAIFYAELLSKYVERGDDYAQYITKIEARWRLANQ